MSDLKVYRIHKRLSTHRNEWVPTDVWFNTLTAAQDYVMKVAMDNSGYAYSVCSESRVYVCEPFFELRVYNGKTWETKGSFDSYKHAKVAYLQLPMRGLRGYCIEEVYQ